MLFALFKGALRWIVSASPSMLVQRPHDVAFGFVAATLALFIALGPNTLLGNAVDAVVTGVIMVALWWLTTYVADYAESTVFTLPRDEATTNATREVDAMIQNALD